MIENSVTDPVPGVHILDKSEPVIFLPLKEHPGGSDPSHPVEKR